MLKRAAPLLIFIFISGCALSESSLTNSIYAADRMVAEAMETAVDLRESGAISDESWPGIKADLKKASMLVDDAWEIRESSPESAESSMDRAKDIIKALNPILGGKTWTP